MADNVTANAGSGGAVFATDDIGGVHYPIQKITFGALDSSTLVSTSNGLPVAQQGTWNITNISGTVSLPTGAATAAKQPALGTAGSASADVISVQGIAAMTPILATLSGANNIGTVTTVSTVTSVTAIANALPAGNNNIGDVDIASQPARAATSDSITAKLATDAIQNGLTALTPKFAAIAAASSGNNTLVAAVTSKKIRVLAIFGIAAGAVSLYFTTATGGTVIFGGSTNKVAVAANGGFVLPFNPVGWMETVAGELLCLNLSGAVAFSGGLVYVEV